MNTQELRDAIVTKEITSLSQLFESANINYVNLHEHLGITKTRLTKLKNDPSKFGTLTIATDVAMLTGVLASILITELRIGSSTITIDELDNLYLEESLSLTKKTA